MRESGYYPLGAEHDSSAPWNQEDPASKEIEVTISLTMSKTVTINVSDYTIIDKGIDEDGNYFEDIDYSSCDFKSAVKEQLALPYQAGSILREMGEDIPKLQDKNYIKDLSNWDIDDFEVYKESIF